LASKLSLALKMVGMPRSSFFYDLNALKKIVLWPERSKI
jgi:hypothetical protein